MKTIADLNGVTLTEEPAEYGWSSTNGSYVTRIWKGTQAEIQNLEPGLQADRTEYTITQGPLWTLSSRTYSMPPVIVPNFELTAQKVTIDLLQSKCPFVAYLDPEIIRVIQETVRNDEPPTFLASGSANTYPNLFSSPAQVAVAADVYLHYISGVKEFTYYVPVLSKTYGVISSYVLAESIANVNRVYSTSTLIAEENVPNSIISLLPPSGPITNVIQNIFNLPLNDVITMNAGWLKNHPQYQQVSPNQFQVTVSYEYNYWSERLYNVLI